MTTPHGVLMRRPWVWLFVVVFLLYGLVTVLVFIPLVEVNYGGRNR